MSKIDFLKELARFHTETGVSEAALSRSIGSQSTIQRWRYRETRPRISTLKKLIPLMDKFSREKLGRDWFASDKAREAFTIAGLTLETTQSVAA